MKLVGDDRRQKPTDTQDDLKKTKDQSVVPAAVVQEVEEPELTVVEVVGVFATQRISNE